MEINYTIVNGWLIYKQDNIYVIDDEAGNKFYFDNYDEAIKEAMKNE